MLPTSGPADNTPHAFIQWKGTDVCLDFYCVCGAGGHFDGYFAYYIQCGECGKVYETPQEMYGFRLLGENEVPRMEPSVTD